MTKIKKPLETAMEEKKAKQTKNVKKLTTSDKAYSPKKLIVEAIRKRPSGGIRIGKRITDWDNIKQEAKDLRAQLPQSKVTVSPQEDSRSRKSRRSGGLALSGYGKAYMKGGRVK